MKQIHQLAFLFVAFAVTFFLTACGEDYGKDIDKLNSQYSDIDSRVSTLENQVKTLNTQLGQLSVLAQAAEQNFYITSVKTTGDTYELTLSNGHVIILQKGEGNTLVPMPAISMTQISGFYYWTINGMLITGDDGKPVRSDGITPIVRYNYANQQWVISIDGGTTFKEVNTYVSVIINDKVLLQVINNYVRENSTSLFSQELLFQIISTYIQRNYASLFDVRILNEVAATYIEEHYTRIFSYEMLEKIFTQYDFSYITDQIDVNQLINILINFIREHQEVFVNNEVLTEIISSYFQVNKDGNIEFPIFGTLHVGGMTTGEISAMIQKRMIEEGYIYDAVVNTKIMSFKVTVMGDVKNPGTQTYQGERLTILEALGKAGDLNNSAYRDNVRVIREENGKRKAYEVNLLNNQAVFNSPAYYLQQNDVIYVQPNKSQRVKGSTSYTWLTVGSTVVGMIVSIVSLVVALKK